MAYLALEGDPCCYHSRYAAKTVVYQIVPGLNYLAPLPRPRGRPLPLAPLVVPVPRPPVPPLAMGMLDLVFVLVFSVVGGAIDFRLGVAFILTLFAKLASIVINVLSPSALLLVEVFGIVLEYSPVSFCRCCF